MPAETGKSGENTFFTPSRKSEASEIDFLKVPISFEETILGTRTHEKRATNAWGSLGILPPDGVGVAGHS